MRGREGWGGMVGAEEREGKARGKRKKHCQTL